MNISSPVVSVQWEEGPISDELGVAPGRAERFEGVGNEEIRNLIGATHHFYGWVRGLEAGKPIAGLYYEKYEPMSTREMHHLATSLAREHGVLAIMVRHSWGFVPVGACSFQLSVAGRHRAETIRLVDQFIDQMKRIVPIWKVPRWQS